MLSLFQSGQLRLVLRLAGAGCRPNVARHGWDNPDSEIEAGNRLGMKTIQVLRPGVPPSERATRQIRGLRELKELCEPTMRVAQIARPCAWGVKAD